MRGNEWLSPVTRNNAFNALIQSQQFLLEVRKISRVLIFMFGGKNDHGLENGFRLLNGLLKIEPGREGQPGMGMLALRSVAVCREILNGDEFIPERLGSIYQPSSGQGDLIEPPAVVCAV